MDLNYKMEPDFIGLFHTTEYYEKIAPSTDLIRLMSTVKLIEGTLKAEARRSESLIRSFIMTLLLKLS